MAYTKRDGAGILVEYSATLGWAGAWTTVPGFMGTVTLPGGQAATWDATTHDDIVGGQVTRQKRAAISDIPNLGGQILWDPGDLVHQALLTAMGARTILEFRFTVFGLSSPKYGARGQVSVSNIQANMDGGVTAQLDIIASLTNFNVA